MCEILSITNIVSIKQNFLYLILEKYFSESRYKLFIYLFIFVFSNVEFRKFLIKTKCTLKFLNVYGEKNYFYVNK